MIDATTNERLYVSTDDTAGPYIIVLLPQLDAVQKLLKQHGIPHSVDEEVISFDGGPEEAVIDLGRDGDADRVHQILDSAD